MNDRAMSQQLTGEFRVKSWDENVVKQLDDGTRLTRASVAQLYSGDMEGESLVEYSMFYRTDNTASFVGLEYFEGRVAGKSGSFVIRHDGQFENGVAKSTWTVVPGSGAAELGSLQGEGSFATLGHELAAYKFQYELD